MADLSSRSITGVILAGGLNSRFNGRNKAMLQLDGKPVIDHVRERLGQFFDEIILVTNQPLTYLEWDLKLVTDLFPIRSSLTGIHTGLFYSQTPYAFFCACDTPFLDPKLIHLLVDSLETRNDVVVPQTDAGLEPLCAIYSKRCLKTVEAHLQARELAIRHLFSKLQVKKIPQARLESIDPHLLSFFNINTPADLARAREMTSWE